MRNCIHRFPRWLHLVTVVALFAGLLGSLFAPHQARAGHTPAPTGAVIAGNFQNELGCPNDWQPGCDSTALAFDADDDVWQATFDLPAGNWAYKVALNGSWDENYGANAQRDGPDITLNLNEAGPVKFYYDHKSHWVTSSRNAVIAVAPGSFQSELGCTDDWAPDCLRSWLQDPDGDGIYTFTTTGLPAGDYEAKVALNESWDVNYGAGGEQGGPNIPFNVANDGDPVTFSYNATSHLLTISTPGVIDEDLAAIVAEPVRHPIQEAVFYFVMPDRFDNGDPTNDQGGLTAGAPGARLVTGFDPTDKGFYHGGDLAGLLGKMDYLEELGITAIWMTPMFKNRPVQGSGSDISAGYHGYWITDFTQIDPHFGTNQELQDVIDAAHESGIKVFFDIITNHTADIIQYQEGQYSYRNKTDFPYRDADGNIFDDRDYVGGDTFPMLDAETSFPYTPVFDNPGDETIKVPAWLNNPIYYHNRGNSTFTGENSLYGDFFGLDDLFTEHPVVVDGLTDIYKFWISDFAIDGFRVDTVKHVNAEFWQQFTPTILEHAAAEGRPDFFIFGEVFSGNPHLLSFYTTGTGANMPAVLDFRFQEQVRSYVSQRGASDGMRNLFADDDFFTDADSNVYALPTFIGNHDRGRFGHFLNADNASSLPDAEMLARSKLAHALMYFARGVPVVYYGDEQGFTGDGDDKDARQDMMPSQVASYNDDNLIGTDATTADANFDQEHPLYTALQTYAALRKEHPALHSGAQIHRYSTGAAGIYAFSRIERDEKVEYLVAVNNANETQNATVPTFYPAGVQFDLIYAEGDAATSLTTDANGALPVSVPPAGFVIYKASEAIPASEAAPAVSVSNLTNDQVVTLGTQNLDGNAVPDRLEIRADVSGGQFVEVTFAVRIAGSDEYTVIGVDDNAPYRVFYNAGNLPDDTTIDILAIVNDLNGNLRGAKVTGVTPVRGERPPPATAYDYAVIHYQRADGDYGDHTTGNFNDFWGLHLWGGAIDPDEVTDWPEPKPFLGEDDSGAPGARFAWIKLQDSSQDVNFIVHRGDDKDGTTADRKFNPNTDSPEIWLKQGDPNFYTTRAAAQGFVTIHYQRPDGVYDNWGLHLWGEGLADGVGTEWDSPRPFDGIDDFGAFWNVPIKDVNPPVNFIIHNGDEKDPGPDQSMNPSEGSDAWVKSGDEMVYRQRGAAENVATIHYHRPAGDYGDPTSNDFRDFWGLHTWLGADDPTWATPRKPTGQDLFGIYFEVPLFENATELGYILHRGDEKDPGPDQFLNFARYGYEVWQLQGADPEKPYILPILRGAVGGGDLSKQRAHWLTRNTIAWDVTFDPSLRYTLHYAAEGGIMLANGAITGGQEIELTHAGPLSAGLQTKWPHLAGYTSFQIAAADLDKVPDILKGQIAIAARTADGLIVNATGLQIPGVLDDLYTYDGPLGVVYNSGAPTLRLWAPTAKAVTLHLFDSSTAAEAAQVIDMTPGEQGTWNATGDAAWTGKYYLYEVEVYVHSTGQVEHNLVTDPYSVGLAMNSKRSLIVNLADPALKPTGWDAQAKPSLIAPEEIVLYELHVRDFSIHDTTVPEAERGTFLAFTQAESNGMRHLKALRDAGLTHMHLLPAFDCATINENAAERVEPEVPNAAPDSPAQQAAVMAVADLDGFNWCYDPFHFGVPEGSYSTDPDGVARIVEFRQMVQALHAAGLRVVMDVVYNHTNSSGQAEKSVLDRVVPGYYHRLNADGVVETSTCCPNTATEHAMMEKLMLDTLAIWATEYGVDGFRFDLMGHHMIENMEQVQALLHAIDPTIYIYGEGWNFGEVANNARGVNATQLNLPGSGIGTFNDRLRDAVRGGGPFDGGDDIVRNQGFATGLYYDPNALNSGSDSEKTRLLHYADQIRVGLAGNLADFEFVDRNGNVVKGSQIDYNGSPAGYTQDPQEHIVYVAAHDNQTLYDIGAYKHPLTLPMSERVRSHNLGLAVSILSQGVPFLHAGEEMLRSKSMDRDSYNSGDWFNKLDFTYQTNNWGVGLPPEGVNGSNWYLIGPRLADPALKPAPDDIEFAVASVQELLAIRKSSPLFRLQTAEDVQARLRFPNTGPAQTSGLIVMSLSDEVDGLPDLDPNHELIVVLFNASDEAQTFVEATLAGRVLALHPALAGSVDAVVKEAAFDSDAGIFTVPARTTAVFVEGEPSGPATITIALDAQPDNPRNFRFFGDLGQFMLTDRGDRPHPQITTERTFTVEPGTYQVGEHVPHFWHLTAIVCDPAGPALVDLDVASVSITVAAGHHVTCTFVNQFAAQVWVRKYHDRNGSGQRENEPGLKDWLMTLYDSSGAPTASGKTNGAGKVHFHNVRPGRYTICEQVRPGWFNSQPGTLDPDHENQPCYTVEAAPAEVWHIYFGNHDDPNLVTVAATAAQSGLMVTTWIIDAEDDLYEDDGWFVNSDETTPDEMTQTYLPLVGR